MSTIHNLKVHPQFWDGLASGAKPFEIRRNDRRFAVGDICLLREYDPKHGYTGKDAIERKITYILHNEDFPIGIHLGFVALGFGDTEDRSQYDWQSMIAIIRAEAAGQTDEHYAAIFKSTRPMRAKYDNPEYMARLIASAKLSPFAKP